MDNKSIHWSLTIGVSAGYDLEHQKGPEEDKMVQIYAEAAAETEEKTGIYISAVIWPTRSIYKQEWGCPKEGEYTFTFTGSCNPAFAETETYKEALLELTQRLKEKLLQSTVLLEIVPAEVFYFR